MRKIPWGFCNDDNNPSSDGGLIDLSSSSKITLNGVSLGDSYVYNFETSSDVIGSIIPNELIIYYISGVITSETSYLWSGLEDTFRLWNSRKA